MNDTLPSDAALFDVAAALGFTFSKPSSVSQNDILEKVLPRIAALRSEHGLPELCAALGWQGGTIHSVIAEIKRLKALDTRGNP